MQNRLASVALVLAAAALLATFTGCESEDSVAGLFDQARRQGDSQAQIICDCWQPLGFETRGECEGQNGRLLPSQAACIEDALMQNESASASYLSCHLALGEDFNACLDSHLVCHDLDQVNPCFDDYNLGARNCVELPSNVQRALDDCY